MGRRQTGYTCERYRFHILVENPVRRDKNRATQRESSSFFRLGSSAAQYLILFSNRPIPKTDLFLLPGRLPIVRLICLLERRLVSCRRLFRTPCLLVRRLLLRKSCLAIQLLIQFVGFAMDCTEVLNSWKPEPSGPDRRAVRLRYADLGCESPWKRSRRRNPAGISDWIVSLESESDIRGKIFAVAGGFSIGFDRPDSAAHSIGSRYSSPVRQQERIRQTPDG